MAIAAPAPERVLQSLKTGLKAVRDDPEFVQVVTKQEEKPDTKLVLKVHNIDMTPHGTYTTVTLAK